MISHVRVGLAELSRDFRERITLKEMQPQRLSLVARQILYNSFPPVPAEESFNRTVVVCSPIGFNLVTINRFVCNSGQIESLGLKSPSP